MSPLAILVNDERKHIQYVIRRGVFDMSDDIAPSVVSSPFSDCFHFDLSLAKSSSRPTLPIISAQPSPKEKVFSQVLSPDWTYTLVSYLFGLFTTSPCSVSPQFFCAVIPVYKPTFVGLPPTHSHIWPTFLRLDWCG